MARAVEARSYTEAHHTVYAVLLEAEPVAVGKRQFQPGRISVTYDWRTQLGETEWSPRLVKLSGPWIDAEGFATGDGSGNVGLLMSQAPQWALDFVTAYTPRTALVET